MGVFPSKSDESSLKSGTPPYNRGLLIRGQHYELKEAGHEITNRSSPGQLELAGQPSSCAWIFRLCIVREMDLSQNRASQSMGALLQPAKGGFSKTRHQDTQQKQDTQNMQGGFQITVQVAQVAIACESLKTPLCLALFRGFVQLPILFLLAKPV